MNPIKLLSPQVQNAHKVTREKYLKLFYRQHDNNCELQLLMKLFFKAVTTLADLWKIQKLIFPPINLLISIPLGWWFISIQ